MQKQSVLPPPESARTLGDHLELFSAGRWSTIVLLGPPFHQGMHRDKDLGKNVPCLPEPCSRCTDPAWRGTFRVEGYAPAFRKNQKLRQWEQVLVVFTGLALETLAELSQKDGKPHRGRQLRGRRELKGNSPWQVIEGLPPLRSDFPALPRAFDVLPFARLKWELKRFVGMTEAELAGIGFEFLPPIPFDDVPDKVLVDLPKLSTPREVLEDLHRELLSKGMTNIAARVEAELGQAPAAASISAPTPPPVSRAAAGVHLKIAAELDATEAELRESAGEQLCREVKEELPATHPAKHGRMSRDEFRKKLTLGIGEPVGPEPSRNGSHTEGGAK